MKYVSIMDTTLRDGEQTDGVSFNKEEKIAIAKYLLEKVKVDSIEVTSAKMSEGEFESLIVITSWAKEEGFLEKIEVLGFVDFAKSAKWAYDAGARVLNLLVKGSLNHLTVQLKKTPKEHLDDVMVVLKFAKEHEMTVNVYLEDWSNGVQSSKDYVFFMINALKDVGVKRIMLADTLGVLNPSKTYDFVKETVERFPGIEFDFHGHNDYGLAVSNSLFAARAGALRIHTTVNGLGERAGNADLSTLSVALIDHYGFNTGIVEKKLKGISRIVENFSGVRISPNAPVVGDYVFTQNCGVHADGDKKGSLYHNRLLPERFGRERVYSLGKTSGVASVEQNLKRLGISLDKETMRKVTVRVVELSEKKQGLTDADLSFIVSDMLGDGKKDKVRLLDKKFVLDSKGPFAWIKIRIGGVEFEESAIGNGQYDAFMNALKKVYNSKGIILPTLADYSPRIPTGGKTSALVETTITWKNKETYYKTKGVDSDQLISAINATIKMLNHNGFLEEKMNMS